MFDLHKKIVTFGLKSKVYLAVQKLCVALDMPVLSETNFYRIARGIEDSGTDKHTEILKTTRAKFHERIEREDPNAPDVKDIQVSCDGSWSKWGFTANYCFVSVIECVSGYVVDFVVLSKYCKVCSENSQRDRAEWWPQHESECDKNSDSSSPAMEHEGWKRLWNRSVEECKFQYTKVVSDGDSKGFATVRDKKPYGDDTPIEKYECVNHVAKRLEKSLHDMVAAKAKEKVTLGGKKKGALPNEKINKLTKYFGYAIRGAKDVQEMKRNIYATLRHCSSSDNMPQHSSCPVGSTSWCFY